MRLSLLGQQSATQRKLRLRRPRRGVVPWRRRVRGVCSCLFCGSPLGGGRDRPPTSSPSTGALDSVRHCQLACRLHPSPVSLRRRWHCRRQVPPMRALSLRGACRHPSIYNLLMKAPSWRCVRERRSVTGRSFQLGVKRGGKHGHAARLLLAARAPATLVSAAWPHGRACVVL